MTNQWTSSLEQNIWLSPHQHKWKNPSTSQNRNNEFIGNEVKPKTGSLSVMKRGFHTTHFLPNVGQQHGRHKQSQAGNGGIFNYLFPSI